MDQWRPVKGIKNRADIGTKRMSIGSIEESGWSNGSVRLQKDDGKRAKPWCQVNKSEAEQLEKLN